MWMAPVTAHVMMALSKFLMISPEFSNFIDLKVSIICSGAVSGIGGQSDIQRQPKGGNEEHDGEGT
jgi:hypothetical protein